jgi:hypothetical protein
VVLRRASSHALLSTLIASRLLWLGVAVAAVLIELGGTSVITGLRVSLVHWDAISYLQIAQNGYPNALDYRDAFLPGFPLLIKAGAFIVRDDVLAAWLIALAGQAIGLAFLYKMVLAERDRSSAAFCVWLTALLPTAVFFIAPFTESPFFAAAAASFHWARRGHAGRAAIAATIASALRLTGLALLPALLLEAMSRDRPRRVRGTLLLALIPLPLLLYCLYMRQHTGDALALFDAQRLPSFGHGVAAPWDGFATTWNTMITATDGETRSIFAREIAFGLLGLVLSVAMWVSRRVPRSWALYCSIAWLMTASLTFWRSEPRYILALFPAVIVVADVTERVRGARLITLGSSAALMGIATWIFATGGWVG